MPNRVAELRRRVDADPSALAFAQLAEEYRRVEQWEDAVRCSRAGLARYPDHHSTRVTLGRALVALGSVDEAAAEFDTVLQAAPDNLPALKAIAAIHEQRGDTGAALRCYERAHGLARFDAGLAEDVRRLRQSATPPTDLDALLASLGGEPASLAPATWPPAHTAPPAALEILPAPPPEDEGPDPFASLERELRAFSDASGWSGVERRQHPPAGAASVARDSGDAESTGVVQQLEAWLRALEGRDTSSRM